MKSRLPILILLAAGFSDMLSAQPFYPESGVPFGTSRQAQQLGPAVILRQGLRKLMDFAAGERRPSRTQAEAFLEQEIAPFFDFAYMASWAVGESVWQRMGDGQRQALEDHIKQDFLTTLAVRMTGFNDQQVQLSPPRSLAANEVMVAVSILNPQTYPARLNFRFYRAPDGWKIFDVTANGSSAVMHYRNQFRRMMRERMMHRQGYRR